MIGLNLIEAKQGFFDRPKVQRSMDRATLRAVSRFGAFVRQRAKTSIRKRKAISSPGQPPSSHLGLIRQIFFAAEAQGNVVIGPMLLRRQSPTALASLEHGGQSLIMRQGKPMEVMIRPRPFMRPAFDAELSKAPKLWENQLRG